MTQTSRLPEYWRQACDELAAADPVMAGLIAAHPQGMLKSRGDALTTLLRAVVGQQISVKAADAVWQRFAQVSGYEDTRISGGVDPQVVLGVGEEELRTCGFSASKVRYVRGICRGFVEGTVHPGLWDGMADEEVIRELVKLPGIGRWTAEMFLIFFLLRPDVLPMDDLGLVKGFRRAYGARWKSGGGLNVWQRRMVRCARVWAPWRSVATWYLWRSLDPVEVEY